MLMDDLGPIIMFERPTRLHIDCPSRRSEETKQSIFFLPIASVIFLQ
jgi:hypothetical protein